MCAVVARHVRRAVELDPTDPEARRLESVILKILGRPVDAVRAAREATRLAPAIPQYWNGLGDALLAAGRYAEAADALRHAIGLVPGYVPALERLELAHARLGEIGTALDVRASRVTLAGHRERAELLGADAARLGPAEALWRDLERERDEQLHRAERVDPFAEYFTTRTLADRVVIAHAQLGEWHHAMDWVERAYDRRPGRLRRMLTDLPFDRRGLAVDSRYTRLLRVAGLEDLL